MRRVIIYLIWAFGMGWLLIWGVSALVKDTLPSGVIWAFLSMIVWWLIGGANKEEQHKR